MKSIEFVILGCGVSGLCAAKMLCDAGKSNILVLDKYPEPGGNQISREVNGFTYDIGAFYYWPSMPLFGMYPEVQKRCLQQDIKIQRISPDGDVGPFPYSLKREFVDKGPVYWMQVAASVVRARMRASPIATAEDFAIYWMGKKLYCDLGLQHYIQRFFGLSADCIEAQFAVSRMQGVARSGRLHFWVRRGYKAAQQKLRSQENQPKEILLVRPESGFSKMYGPAVEALSQLGVEVRLNQQIEHIKKDQDSFTVTTKSELIKTQNLINTVPIQHICRYLNISAGSELECVTLATMFISFSGSRKFDAPILYNWGRAGCWKRLTMHSDYYGPRQGAEYASVEVPMFRSPNINIEALFADFVSSTQAYGIFQGSLKLEGSELVENAYPAHIIGASNKVKRAVSALSELGIQSVGRQGRFDYLPTGEQVVKQVSANLRV